VLEGRDASGGEAGKGYEGSCQNLEDLHSMHPSRP